MNNFSELLATKGQLIVIIDGTEQHHSLHDTLILNAKKPTTVNGLEVLPKYSHLAQNDILRIPAPFYTWYHEVSGQGWLLIPAK